jgi:hypothetical protein
MSPAQKGSHKKSRKKAGAKSLAQKGVAEKGQQYAGPAIHKASNTQGQ